MIPLSLMSCLCPVCVLSVDVLTTAILTATLPTATIPPVSVPPMSWQDNLITTPEAVRALLERARRIAVLGIKTSAQADAPAFHVPQYQQAQGYTIIPVPVYYPEATHILGEPVHRDLATVPGPVDILQVFRRPQDIPAHLDAMLALKPGAVWFQRGIRHDEAAQALAQAGILVVQDRCIYADHRDMGIAPLGPQP